MLFQCQRRHWGFMHFFSVVWQKWCGLLCLNCLFDFQLCYVLLLQEGMFSLTFMPTNSPWNLTSLLGSFFLEYQSQQWASCQLCCAISNTCKSAQCPYYVFSHPDCLGLQAYRRSRLLLFFILFVLSKLGWWSQWIHIAGTQRLGPSFFPLIMRIAFGSVNLKTSFKW